MHGWRFQSAPAIAGGRCTAKARACSGQSSFQSAPAIAGGRCALRSCRCQWPSCFNPRPPLLAGDAQSDVPEAIADKVSIRARHCWRAMRWDTITIAGQTYVSIRARHCWRAMPSQMLSYRMMCLFQSAPAIAGGRCGNGRGNVCAVGCFNPRPPLLAGDAKHSYQHGRTRQVSIRARHCWRAMRAPSDGLPGRSSFNPRPPLLAGDAHAPCV